MTTEPTRTPVSGDVASPLGVASASGVRTRVCRDGVLVLAPDGVTALVFDDADVAVLQGGDTAERRALTVELDHCGIRAGTIAATSPRRGLRLTRRGVEADGLDRLARRAHRRIGFRLRRVLAVLGAVATVLALIRLVVAGIDTSAAGTGLGPVGAAGVLFAVSMLLAVVHELGHGVVLVGYGGRIGTAGFGFHWGAPSFYVDSTAALFLPRRHRIIQAAAGVAAELAVAAVIVLTAAVLDTAVAGYVAGATATYAMVSLVTNGAPVLGLDGALIVSDLTDRPTLPAGATRTRRRYRSVAGIIDLVVGIAALGATLWIWTVLWWDLLAPLWHAGFPGRIAAALTIIPTAAALAVGFATLVRDDPTP